MYRGFLSPARAYNSCVCVCMGHRFDFEIMGLSGDAGGGLGKSGLEFHWFSINYDGIMKRGACVCPDALFGYIFRDE